MKKKHVIAILSIMFVLTVYFANWLVNRYGPIRVWPTTLYAPAGVYVIGLAFLLRDTIQRFAGQFLAIGLIGMGAGLSAIVSPRLALASACAFVASEIVGLLVFWILRGNVGGPLVVALAVVMSSLFAAALDSYIFLQIAFGDQTFFKGQFVAKMSVTVLALPLVLFVRRCWPTPALAV